MSAQPATSESEHEAARAAELIAEGAAPRPPQPDDIAAMMAAAEAAAAGKHDDRRESHSSAFLVWALWAGVILAVTAGIYVMTVSQSQLGLILASGVLALIAAFLVAGAFGLFSPALVAATALGRPAQAADGGRLAGVSALAGLDVTGRVLDADPDPKLVTKRDGVVVYANVAYFDLAEEAGLIGGSGLPPRIDRLFGQQGADAAKVFRLCRAAKSGAAASEILTQIIGVENGGVRRRFDVSTAPVDGAGDYAAWSLRELPAEEERHDLLAAAFADYVRPVFALERSGQIAWANTALREEAGAARGGLRSLDDIVLGETADLLRALWRADGAPQKAMLRRRDKAPAEAVMTGFRRGGPGEGYICVDVKADDAPLEEEKPSVSGDFSEAPFGVAVIDGDIGREARLLEMNRAFAEAFEGAARNTPLSKFLPADAIESLAEEARRKAGGGAMRAIDAVVGDGPGARTYALLARAPKRRRGGYGQRRAYLYALDVSDRKRMEADYAQDQKLKAIGNIAGEIAHDFNNLLQVVLSNCEDMMLRHPAGDPSYEDLVLIRENAQRAANLTKQLLAYSRKQTLTAKRQSITDLLLDFTRFLNRAVGEKVKVDLINGRGLPPVRVDRTQLETAIMNLAVNARDAMGAEGGVLTIRTRLAPAEEIEALDLPALGRQDHVLITVSDTGPGIPYKIMAEIFEPFFTTKEEGKGTGLGLSAVQGVIAQLGGAITVANGAEGGAVFSIYLPTDERPDEVASPQPAAGAAPQESPDFSGAGRILIVEDEEGVRFAVKKTLGRAGYDLVIADDGVEALEILESDPEFSLIITDVMMPEVDGPTMVARMRKELGLTIPVIYMSGYAEAAVRDQIGDDEEVRFIQKPFSNVDLGAKVKEALHGA